MGKQSREDELMSTKPIRKISNRMRSIRIALAAFICSIIVIVISIRLSWRNGALVNSGTEKIHEINELVEMLRNEKEFLHDDMYLKYEKFCGDLKDKCEEDVGKKNRKNFYLNYFPTLTSMKFKELGDNDLRSIEFVAEMVSNIKFDVNDGHECSGIYPSFEYTSDEYIKEQIEEQRKEQGKDRYPTIIPSFDFKGLQIDDIWDDDKVRDVIKKYTFAQIYHVLSNFIKYNENWKIDLRDNNIREDVKESLVMMVNNPYMYWIQISTSKHILYESSRFEDVRSASELEKSGSIDFTETTKYLDDILESESIDLDDLIVLTDDWSNKIFEKHLIFGSDVYSMKGAIRETKSCSNSPHANVYNSIFKPNELYNLKRSLDVLPNSDIEIKENFDIVILIPFYKYINYNTQEGITTSIILEEKHTMDVVPWTMLTFYDTLVNTYIIFKKSTSDNDGSAKDNIMRLLHMYDNGFIYINNIEKNEHRSGIYTEYLEEFKNIIGLVNLKNIEKNDTGGIKTEYLKEFKDTIDLINLKTN